MHHQQDPRQPMLQPGQPAPFPLPNRAVIQVRLACGCPAVINLGLDPDLPAGEFLEALSEIIDKLAHQFRCTIDHASPGVHRPALPPCERTAPALDPRSRPSTYTQN